MLQNNNDLRKHFPGDTAVPELLQKFLGWRNGWYQAHPGEDLRDYLGFDLCADGDLRNWFGPGAQAAVSRFVVFGHNGSGGQFAYWRYHNQAVGAAPIVLLDSEGAVYSAVLANSLSDFLKLLAAGDEELFSLPDEEDEYLPVLENLQTWLRQDCHLELLQSTDDVDALLEDAAQSHPDLRAWLQAQTGA